MPSEQAPIQFERFTGKPTGEASMKGYSESTEGLGGGAMQQPSLEAVIESLFKVTNRPRGEKVREVGKGESN